MHLHTHTRKHTHTENGYENVCVCFLTKQGKLYDLWKLNKTPFPRENVNGLQWYALGHHGTRFNALWSRHITKNLNPTLRWDSFSVFFFKLLREIFFYINSPDTFLLCLLSMVLVTSLARFPLVVPDLPGLPLLPGCTFLCLFLCTPGLLKARPLCHHSNNCLKGSASVGETRSCLCFLPRFCL